MIYAECRERNSVIKFNWSERKLPLNEFKNQSLRWRALKIIIISVLLLIGFVFILMSTVVYSRFSRIEQDHALENMKRVEQGFLNIVEALEIKSADWAIWDDTYQFIKDRNDAYITSNLSPSSLSNLQINDVVYFDTNANPTFKISLDWEKKIERPFQNEILKDFRSDSRFFKYPELTTVYSGVFMFSQGPLITVARPILNSQAQGPIEGTLVFAQDFDQEQLLKLSQRVKLNLKILPWDGRRVYQWEVRELNWKTLSGKVLIKDIYDQPAFILYAEIPREILRQALWSFGLLFVLLLITAALFTGIVFALIDRMFLKRLNVLTQQFVAIGNSVEIEGYLQMEGNDELTELTGSFNKIITEINKKREDINKVNQKLHENLKDTKHKNKLLEDSKRAILSILEDLEIEKKKVSKQKEDLEKVNLELDSFVYTASHDLRAPLRGISSFATFLYDDYKDKIDDDGKGYIEEIRKGAERLSRLIDDLLTLSRITRIKNPFEDVVVTELVRSILERIEFDVKSTKVDLVIQEDLPVIRCDRIKLEEVFLNLINNAIKFSSKNTEKLPRVEVGYKMDEEFHQFFVRDNGIGIAPEHHQQVFEMFKRLHSNREYEGTGAGLSIVKRVIDDHKGKVWIESVLGEGATFWFSISKNLKTADMDGE